MVITAGASTVTDTHNVKYDTTNKVLIAGLTTILAGGTPRTGITSVLSLTGYSSGNFTGDVLINQTAGAYGLSYGQLCYMDAGGIWQLADASGSATAINMLGVCVKTAAIGFVTDILIRGFFSTPYGVSSTYTPNVGDQLYMDGPSGLTGNFATLDEVNTYYTSGNIVRSVGFVAQMGGVGTVQTIYFNPSNDYITL